MEVSQSNTPTLLSKIAANFAHKAQMPQNRHGSTTLVPSLVLLLSCVGLDIICSNFLFINGALVGDFTNVVWCKPSPTMLCCD